MKRMVYMALAEIADDRILYAMPTPVRPVPEEMPDLSCAVYAAEDRSGRVCYVGGYRPADYRGLGSHIAEYLRDDPRTEKWDKVYVLPLRHDIPELDVRLLCGEVAGWLLPYDRERWPQASSPGIPSPDVLRMAGPCGARLDSAACALAPPGHSVSSCSMSTPS